MYLAVDVGGTKTLLAVFSTDGQLIAKHKVPTSKSYAKFLKELKSEVANFLADYKITHCCCALPGFIDRRRGLALELGNLPWHHVAIKQDLKQIFSSAAILIENDGNLAGLSEALLVHKKYKKVLYITIGTGIGDAVIINGKIDPSLSDGEGGKMVLEHDGELKAWEDFASGRNLKESYGKLASEIDDPAIWTDYAKRLALGLNPLISVFQPEVVIIGGGVGAHFDKFGDKLEKELEARRSKVVGNPPLVQAKRPEEAVVYGCYDYIRQNS